MRIKPAMTVKPSFYIVSGNLALSVQNQHITDTEVNDRRSFSVFSFAGVLMFWSILPLHFAKIPPVIFVPHLNPALQKFYKTGNASVSSPTLFLTDIPQTGLYHSLSSKSSVKYGLNPFWKFLSVRCSIFSMSFTEAVISVSCFKTEYLFISSFVCS